MLKQEDGGGGGGSNKWARTCDSCRSAACTVYCKADSAYLCNGCDARIHAVNKLASRHERVWVCEACERAPAAFLCKADAASLCTTCDSDIHSANPLARRHQRVPILPISGTGSGAPASEDDAFTIIDEDEAASWLLLDPEKNNNGNDDEQGNNNNNSTNGMQFDGEVVDDEYLDLVDYMSGLENQFVDQCSNERQQYNFDEKKSFEGDGVVPAAPFREQKDQIQLQQQHHQSFQLGLQYDGYQPSTAYNVSVSCMEVGVVPESEMTEISSTHERSPKGTIDLFSSPPVQIAQQLSPMDREARVLRYREKKKMRKFEKTIRYASRKAYAETRPRIKGRFAKRTDADVEVDQMFSDAGYGIVPSF